MVVTRMNLTRVYTLEVGGEPVLTFEAHKHSEAVEITREGWMHDDLRGLKSRGLPLWDGLARLSVRVAMENEIAVFRESKAAADPTEDSSIVLAFLKELD